MAEHAKVVSIITMGYLSLKSLRGLNVGGKLENDLCSKIPNDIYISSNFNRRMLQSRYIQCKIDNLSMVNFADVIRNTSN